MVESNYLQKYGDSATLAIDLPLNSKIEHYVIYSEFYVLDILCAKAPTVEVLKYEIK